MIIALHALNGVAHGVAHGVCYCAQYPLQDTVRAHMANNKGVGRTILKCTILKLISRILRRRL